MRPTITEAPSDRLHGPVSLVVSSAVCLEPTTAEGSGDSDNEVVDKEPDCDRCDDNDGKTSPTDQLLTNHLQSPQAAYISAYVAVEVSVTTLSPNRNRNASIMMLN